MPKLSHISGKLYDMGTLYTVLKNAAVKYCACEYLKCTRAFQEAKFSYLSEYWIADLRYGVGQFTSILKSLCFFKGSSKFMVETSFCIF